jgi:hypothetical protein
MLGQQERKEKSKTRRALLAIPRARAPGAPKTKDGTPEGVP